MYAHTKPACEMFRAALFTIAKKLEMTQMSIDRLKDKQRVYPCNGIPLSNKRALNIDTHHSIYLKPKGT